MDRARGGVDAAAIPSLLVPLVDHVAQGHWAMSALTLGSCRLAAGSVRPVPRSRWRLRSIVVGIGLIRLRAVGERPLEDDLVFGEGRVVLLGDALIS